MKKIILKYGGYAALFELITFILTWLIIDITNVSHWVQGFIGYVTIISPLVFVYFGIRYYRDRVNNGTITFLKGLGIGLLIVTIPTISFAIIETVYVLYIDPKFYDNIMAYDIGEYRKVMSPAQFAVKLNEMKQALVLYHNPFYNFFGMILTVGALGIIVTLISSVLLVRKGKIEGSTKTVAA